MIERYRIAQIIYLFISIFSFILCEKKNSTIKKYFYLVEKICDDYFIISIAIVKICIKQV